MISKKVLFEGRVQGVGFRYTTKQIARGYEVTGWVRNLPDGRVEMMMTGEGEEIEAFLREIREGSLAHHLRAVDVTDLPDVEEVRGFGIR